MWKSIKYTDDRLEEIIDMTIEYYGEDNDISQKPFLKHEYFNNPCGNAHIKLAYDEDNNVLAGQYIVIPMKVKVADKEYPVILSLNTLTKENYRGQKIFTTLANEVYDECIKNGYRFCYGAPNPNSHRGFLKHLGFRDIGVMPLYLKIIHPSQLIKQKFGLSFLEALARPFDILFRIKHVKSTHSIVEINESHAADIDNFWKMIRTKYTVMGVRDYKFIQWRYINMPGREYKIFAVYDESKIIGYIVGRITEVAGMKCGMIVDFLAVERMAAAVLIERVQQEFYKQEVGLMGCLMQRHFEEAKWLRETGFFECPKFMEPQPFPIIYRKFNSMENDREIEDFTNWFFTMGDYDVI